MCGNRTQPLLGVCTSTWVQSEVTAREFLKSNVGRGTRAATNCGTCYTVWTAGLIPSLLSSFDNFSAQSLSKMNPRKPFLRIIFRYIFKAKFSAQTLTLAAKHLQMIPTWGENIGLEVKFGIGSWLGIFGNYVTSMSFASPPSPHRQWVSNSQRCCRERMNKPLRTLNTLITR